MITLTDFAKDHAMRLSSGEVWLYLLTVSFGAPTPKSFYYVNNTEAITSSGQKFDPCQFAVNLSIDDNDHMAVISLSIDNVDRQMINEVRTKPDAPAIDLKVIIASNPNDIQAQFSGLFLREIVWNLTRLEGSIYAEDLLSIRYPADLIGYESGYQALFRQ